MDKILTQIPWTNFLAIVAILSIIATAIFLYLNRQKKEIFVALLALLIGLTAILGESDNSKIFSTLAIIGTCTALTTLLLGVKQDTKQDTICKTIFFEIESGHPLLNNNIPFLRVLWGDFKMTQSTSSLFQDSLTHSSNLISNIDSDRIHNAEVIYHNIIFCQILETLASYGAWMAKVNRTRIPTLSVENSVVSNPIKSKQLKHITQDEIAKKLLSNPLIGGNLNLHSGIPIPKGAKYMISDGEIKIEDYFVTLSIKLLRSGGTRGLSPVFKKMLGRYSVLDGDYWTQSFNIELNASFNKWISGHPKMPEYHAWVQRLIDELRICFDTEHHWQEAQTLFTIDTKD